MHIIAGEVVSKTFLVEMEVGREQIPTKEGKSIDAAEEDDESPPEDSNSDAPEHRKDEEGIDYGCTPNGRICCLNPLAPCPRA